ncbi:MAG TPA: LPS assembly lipoprotein LptE [Candidatus Binatia bacterium]|jgi:outer membrane lipopolysaccharide assembly protein LptE/RlpB
MRDKLQLWVRRAATLLVSGGMLLGATGCGYQLAGQSLLLSQDIHRIYVEPFVSRSRDVGIDKELTSALRSEFYRRGEVKVVDQLDQADAIVSGVIRSLDSHVASVNRKDEVLQWESVMILDVSLRRREPNEILWRAQGTRLTQIYSGSRAAVVTTSSEFHTGTLSAEDIRHMTDIQLTESDKQRVREQLIEGFAQQLHQRLLEMF